MRVRHPRLIALLLGVVLCFSRSSSSAQESSIATDRTPASIALQRESSDLSHLEPANLEYLQSTLRDSRSFQQQALWALLNNSSDPDVVISLLRLDGMYPVSGIDSEAGLVLIQVLRIAENALRLGDASVVNALLDLAVLRRASGDIDGATEIYGGVLAIRSTALEADAPNSMRVRPPTSQHFELHSNDLERAEARFEQQIERRGAILDSEPLEIASSLDELGSIYYRKGRFTLARAQFARALAIREERLGSSHPQVASSLSNLANSYYSENSFDRAESHSRRALEIREKMLGPQHPDVASSLAGLAWIRLRTGFPRQAQELLERALAIRVGHLGLDHPDTLSFRTSLALILKMCSQCTEAIPSSRVAIREPWPVSPSRPGW